MSWKRLGSAIPPVWAELRDRAPVYRTAAGMYVVSRYNDVRNIQRSPGLFSNRPQADEAGNFPADADADPEQLEMLGALMAGFPSEVTVEELTSARTTPSVPPLSLRPAGHAARRSPFARRVLRPGLRAHLVGTGEPRSVRVNDF